jgi:hypothetical protein
MSESGLYIEDSNTLKDLRREVTKCGTKLQQTMQEVNAYLQKTVSSLEEQKGVHDRKLNEAERELYEAQSIYEVCRNSQRYDKEKQRWYPSCSIEEREVDDAQRYRDKCKVKADKAKEIAENAGYTQRQYQRETEKGLQSLAQDHTNATTQKLDGIISAVDDYLGDSPSGSSNSGGGFSSDKGAKLNSAIDNVNRKIQSNEFRKASNRIEEIKNEKEVFCVMNGWLCSVKGKKITPIKPVGSSAESDRGR